MLSSTKLFLLFVVSYLITTQRNCPQPSPGLILTGSLTFGTNGAYKIDGIQSNQYEHTLRQSFTLEPQVAISLNHLETIASPYVMLSVKHIASSKLHSLTFSLRFYYKYTNWKTIRINFLAQDRTDIDSNYYQIDTGELMTSNVGKAIKVTLPFGIQYEKPIFSYYISGLQVSSVADIKQPGLFSPFQLQITTHQLRPTDFTLVVSINTQTQLLSLTISFVSFEQESDHFKGGIYSYSSLSPASFLSFVVQTSQNTSLFFGGVASFLIGNNDGSFYFSASLPSATSQVTLLMKPAGYYLNYHYFVLKAPNSSCFYCQNTPFSLDGTCVTICPNSTVASDDTCIRCPNGVSQDGTKCLQRCTGGQTFSSVTSKCQCPQNLSWNGTSCIQCPSGQRWNTLRAQCSCPDANFFDGSACFPLSTCVQPRSFNPNDFTCSCPSRQFWSGNNCSVCSQGQQWTGSACECPFPFKWNGKTCINCISGRIWQESTRQCVCPRDTTWSGTQCQTVILPQCPSGSRLINGRCTQISCNPGQYWNSTACVRLPQSNLCPQNSFWNGQSCTTFAIRCPQWFSWNGSSCIVTAGCSQSSCQNPLPSLCPPQHSWNGSHCIRAGQGACPQGHIYDGSVCIMVDCILPRIWSNQFKQCVCPSNSFWNGETCINCPSGQVYLSGVCQCPQGFFMIQQNCYSLQAHYCTMIQNTNWNGTACICNPGFQAIGINCVCRGLAINNICDPCTSIPNSQWINRQCVCRQGFSLQSGRCINTNSITNTPVASSCPPGTFRNTTSKICVDCSSGCISCVNHNTCLQCLPQFSFNYGSFSCIQICGDGKRFRVACDDGNNLNGDGCDQNCQIQYGFSCSGGSPNSPDQCTSQRPSSIVISQTGSTHLFGKIVLNVRANYLPSNLTNPSHPCLELCSNILSVSLVGNIRHRSIQSQYRVSSASFSFWIEVDFGYEPIGEFDIRVSINPQVGRAFFGGIDYSNSYLFRVYPQFLSLVVPDDYLK